MARCSNNQDSVGTQIWGMPWPLASAAHNVASHAGDELRQHTRETRPAPELGAKRNSQSAKNVPAIDAKQKDRLS